MMNFGGKKSAYRILRGAVGLVLAAGVLAGCLVPAFRGKLLVACSLLGMAYAGVTFYMGKIRLKKLEHSARMSSASDAFTGLKNLDCLRQDYRELGEYAGMALVWIWINQYHQINAHFGLELAGKTIQRLSDSLKEFASQHGGRAYRVSLDSMALLCPAKEKEEFGKALSGLIHSLEQVNFENRQIVYTFHYTFAYGVYYMEEQDREAQKVDRILDVLRESLYSYLDGQETVGIVVEGKERPDWAHKKELLSKVRHAWENKEFVPFYQPVYSIKSQKPVGAEIRACWEHPEFGVLEPKDFLWALEEEGLIMDLDLYMLEEACKKIRGWMEAELVTVPISVNLSGMNLLRPDFTQKVISIVREYDVPPILIELELPESFVMLEKNASFLAAARELHQFGFSLAMDNVAATDYSSVSLLRYLPLSTIKLHYRFFTCSADAEIEEPFIRNILETVRKLGLKAIGEGVKTKEQAQVLSRFGCDYGQGPYFSRPLSNDEFEKLIF